MAVKYLVKSISNATEANENFKNTTVICYTGKGGTTCGLYKICGDSTETIVKLIPKYDVREHGYARLCDAKRNYDYTHPENTEYWTTSVEIVAFEI